MKNMMAQAQAMQAKMQAFQEKVATFEVVGTSGGGLVTVTISGKGALSQVTIDPSLLTADEKEVLEDLLVAAFADARQRMDKLTSDELAKITNGLSLPPGFPGF